MRASGGALRSGGIPTVNMDAETNPKAKTITTIRYVHRKRISERFSGKGDETVAGKVDVIGRSVCSCSSRSKPRRSAPPR
jgi:hypothetical protein